MSIDVLHSKKNGGITMINNLGQKIRNIRKTKGLTMEEFGKLFSPPASKGVVSNWENNYNRPNNERLKKIAEFGGISVEELLYGQKKDYIKTLVVKIANYYYNIDISDDNKLINHIVSRLSDYSYTTDFVDLYTDNEELFNEVFFPNEWLSEDYIYWTELELSKLSRHIEDIYDSTSSIYNDTPIEDSIKNTIDKISFILSQANENISQLYTDLSKQISMEEKELNKIDIDIIEED